MRRALLTLLALMLAVVLHHVAIDVFLAISLSILDPANCLGVKKP